MVWWHCELTFITSMKRIVWESCELSEGFYRVGFVNETRMHIPKSTHNVQMTNIQLCEYSERHIYEY